MKDFSDLKALDDKKLRTLRNNLNNRLQGFKQSAGAKHLSPSHMLHGMEEGDCSKLLEKVQVEMKKRSKS